MSIERPRYVLDSFALLAYLAAEPGEAQVKPSWPRRRLAGPKLISPSSTTAKSSTSPSVNRACPPPRRAIAAIDQLPIILIEADRKQTFAAAHVKAHHAISYADAFAAALAEQLTATLLTGDPEFRKVEGRITIEWLPQPDRAIS